MPSQISILISSSSEMVMNVQVRVDAWDLGFREILRKGRQPALRLPLQRVFAPELLARVASLDPRKYLGARRYGQLRYEAAVRPARYGLQTTKPISEEELIAPFMSTIVPSASYLADPLNAYSHLGTLFISVCARPSQCSS